MNSDKPNSPENEVERKLIEIRESINAPIGRSNSIRKRNGPVTGADLADNAAKYPEQPIFINGEIHMVYIKDNYLRNIHQHNNEINNPPNNRCFVSGKKVHFYYCKTLQYMDDEGRMSRYRETRETKNTYLIDLRDVENLGTRLPWCKYCIDVLCRKGKVFQLKYRMRIKDKIAKYGDAKELMACVEAYDNNTPTAVQEIKDFVKKTIRKE